MVENNAVGQPYNPAVIFQKQNKFNDNFHNGIFLSELSLGLMWIFDPEWAEQNGGGKKHRQNSKTSPFGFIFFPFAFRTTDEQQFGFA